MSYNSFIEIYPVINDIINPMLNGAKSAFSNVTIFLISRIDAPTIMGIARKKDNLKASFFSIPKNNAPDIVIPLRDIPGNIANA